MIAVDWATRAPRKLAGGVLINTSLRPFSPWYQRLRPINYPVLLALALTPDPVGHERAILWLTSRNPAAAADVLADWTRLRRTRPVSASNARRQQLAAARYRAPPMPPPVPLLVLTSRCDQLVDRAARGSWRDAGALTSRFIQPPNTI